jgi:hypothetical protein
VELSSPISMMASPDRVASVFVGETGDWGVFSSASVSPVNVRARVWDIIASKRDQHVAHVVGNDRKLRKTGHVEV